MAANVHTRLLVLIGFTAAFIISLFPKPITARKIVRLRAAKIIDVLAELYVDELKGFLLEAKESNEPWNESKVEERAGLYRSRVLDVVVSPALRYALSIARLT
jgi:hypothetical protein